MPASPMDRVEPTLPSLISAQIPFGDEGINYQLASPSGLVQKRAPTARLPIAMREVYIPQEKTVELEALASIELHTRYGGDQSDVEFAAGITAPPAAEKWPPPIQSHHVAKGCHFFSVE